MHEELWKKIVIVHNSGKAYFLWCEENGVQLKSFLQPNNEFKNAWEHFTRGKAIELGLKTTDNPNYMDECLGAILSHEYRAFFDVCDWLSMTLRDKIISQLAPYDHETITAVIPEYYTKIRPNLDQACNEIAKLRGCKDVAQADILGHVDKYDAILKDLIKDVQQVETFVPTLEENKISRKVCESKSSGREIKFIILGAVILAMAEWIFSLFSKK